MTKGPPEYSEGPDARIKKTEGTARKLYLHLYYSTHARNGKAIGTVQSLFFFGWLTIAVTPINSQNAGSSRMKCVELPAHAYIALKILFLLFPHIYYENKNRR